jgi:hypothetical protein
MVKSGVNTIYIGTYASAEPSVGELRFIARLSKSAVPTGVVKNGEQVSEMNGGTAIEGTDVYLLDGQTRSKFYSSVRQFLLSNALQVNFEETGPLHSRSSTWCYWIWRRCVHDYSWCQHRDFVWRPVLPRYVHSDGA